MLYPRALSCRFVIVFGGKLIEIKAKPARNTYIYKKREKENEARKSRAKIIESSLLVFHLLRYSWGFFQRQSKAADKFFFFFY